MTYDVHLIEPDICGFQLLYLFIYFFKEILTLQINKVQKSFTSGILQLLSIAIILQKTYFSVSLLKCIFRFITVAVYVNVVATYLTLCSLF